MHRSLSWITSKLYITSWEWSTDILAGACTGLRAWSAVQLHGNNHCNVVCFHWWNFLCEITKPFLYKFPTDPTDGIPRESLWKGIFLFLYNVHTSLSAFHVQLWLTCTAQIGINFDNRFNAFISFFGFLLLETVLAQNTVCGGQKPYKWWPLVGLTLLNLRQPRDGHEVRQHQDGHGFGRPRRTQRSSTTS